MLPYHLHSMIKWIEPVQSQDLQEIMEGNSFETSSSGGSGIASMTGLNRSQAARSYDQTDLMSSSSSESVSFTMGNDDVLQDSRNSWRQLEDDSFHEQSDCKQEEIPEESEETQDSSCDEWANGTVLNSSPDVKQAINKASLKICSCVGATSEEDEASEEDFGFLTDNPLYCGLNGGAKEHKKRAPQNQKDVHRLGKPSSSCKDMKQVVCRNSKELPVTHTLFIQMQLYDDLTLQNWLSREERTVNPSENMAIFRQIVEGLHHVHAAHIIHRDLKVTTLYPDQLGVSNLCKQIFLISSKHQFPNSLQISFSQMGSSR